MRRGWRNQRREDFHDCYYSQNIFKAIETTDGSCSTHGKHKYACGVWRENVKERAYLEDMLTWEDNIKIGLNPFQPSDAM
jgi:hypothetical protein